MAMFQSQKKVVVMELEENQYCVTQNIFSRSGSECCTEADSLVVR